MPNALQLSPRHLRGAEIGNGLICASTVFLSSGLPPVHFLAFTILSTIAVIAIFMSLWLD